MEGSRSGGISAFQRENGAKSFSIPKERGAQHSRDSCPESAAFSLLQITFEISKPEESQIPIWIILGSTFGGLLLLALLVLALWKVS